MNVIFPLVIHWDMSVSYTHLFISIASLSLMEQMFLNHYPCMPSWLGDLRFDTFPNISLRCIFALEPSSSPRTSFPQLLINSAPRLCSLRSHILLQNCFVSLSSACCYVVVHSPPCRIFFRCFGMSCFSLLFNSVSISAYLVFSYLYIHTRTHKTLPHIYIYIYI